MQHSKVNLRTSAHILYQSTAPTNIKYQVKFYQLYRHSRTCRKCKDEAYRFNQRICQRESSCWFCVKEMKFFVKVKDYVNNFLNPSKINFFNHPQDNFIKVESISDVLEELGITEEEYENALKRSDNNGFQLQLIHALLVITFIYVCMRPADSNSIVIVKLKRKLPYRGHVYLESVRPNFILRLLQYLDLNDLLYHDI